MSYQTYGGVSSLNNPNVASVARKMEGAWGRFSRSLAGPSALLPFHSMTTLVRKNGNRKWGLRVIEGRVRFFIPSRRRQSVAKCNAYFARPDSSVFRSARLPLGLRH